MMNDGSQFQDTGSLQDQNRLLTVEIQRRTSQLAALNVVAATVSQSLDLDRTFNIALDAVLSIIPVEAAGISLVDKDANALILRAQRGLKLDFVSQPMTIPLREGLSGEAVARDEVIVTGDLTRENRLAVPSFIREQIKAQALAPMHARGRVIGILSVMSHAAYAFSEAEINTLRAIADQVGVALDNARLFEEVQHQEKRLKAVIHSAADAIIATDAVGNISLVNHAAGRYFDVHTEQVIGLPLAEAPIQATLRDRLHHALQSADETATLFEVEPESGKTLMALVSRLRSESQVDHAMSDEGYVVVLRDITPLKKAEAARMEFVQTAAHDLRNPLGVTLSALIMLHDFLDPDDAAVHEIYGIAVDAMNRMHLLLEDLVNLEEIQNIDPTKFVLEDTSALLRDALREMRPLFETSGHTSALDVPDSLPSVSISRRWMHRAIINYLNNANKYTPSGGHIILRSYVQGGELLIEVQDTGPGIPQDQQGRLFERFYRVPSSRESAQGTGLGLPMVKSVAEAHGGRIYLRSQPGKGSLFGIALPLAGHS